MIKKKSHSIADALILTLAGAAFITMFLVAACMEDVKQHRLDTRQTEVQK